MRMPDAFRASLVPAGLSAPVARAFHERPVVELARALLGAFLVRRLPDGELLAGRIVETEAYGGLRTDPSAHSFGGMTPRCATMFGPAGHAYVYATQGRCHCVNVSAEGDGTGRAVLVRALEPVLGIERMLAHRLARLADGPTRRRLAAGAVHELAKGPGRLCVALAIDRALDGHDLTARDARDGRDGRGTRNTRNLIGSGALWIAAGPPPARIRWTPRVGLNPTSASFAWRWRALDADSRAVSAGPPGAAPAARPRPLGCPPADG